MPGELAHVTIGGLGFIATVECIATPVSPGGGYGAARVTLAAPFVSCIRLFDKMEAKCEPCRIVYMCGTAVAFDGFLVSLDTGEPEGGAELVVRGGVTVDA